jgi:hypothetical protein
MRRQLSPKAICMHGFSRPRTDYREIPLLVYLLTMVALLVTGGMLLYRLLQPTVLANPGLAAYQSTLGTRPFPLFAKRDPPELATANPEPLPLVAPAQELEKRPKDLKRESRPKVRKPQTLPRRELQEPAFRYTQPWNGGHQWAGGARSLF